MVSDARYIYAIPISGKHLVYAPLKKLAALVNGKAVASLGGWLRDDAGGKQPIAGLEPLCEGVEEPDGYMPEMKTGPISPAFLGIIPSRSCNLACSYCSFGAAHAPREQMNPLVAASAVEWMAENCAQRGETRLEVHFFGGEPLVAADVVEVVVHKARAMAEKLGLVPHLELSTNGLFDQDWAGFVGDYFDTVVLSLDGPADIHDRQRPRPGGGGSFEAVVATARCLAQSQAELCLRGCISSGSVARMEEIAGWFCEAFDPKAVNFETLQPTVRSDSAGLRPPDPYEFARHFIRAEKVAREAGVTTVHASAEIGKNRFSFCPVGTDTLVVSPDGRVSSCYLPEREWKARGLDFHVGSVGRRRTFGIDLEHIEALRDCVTTEPDRCARCFCRWTCSGGCRVNHSYPGCSRHYDDFCIQTRIITACRLLLSLGLPDLVEPLISRREDMQLLALKTSDRLDAWENQDAGRDL